MLRRWGRAEAEERESSVSHDPRTVAGSTPAPGESLPLEEVAVGPPLLPDHMPLYRHLDPAAALAFRTPLQEHAPAADTKAAAILTALGIMLPLLARYGQQLSTLLWGIPGVRPSVWWALGMTVSWILLLGFVALSIAALIQAFHTFSPRLPDVPPSLAFFGDIAKLSREEYLEAVCSLSHDDALKNMLSYNHNLSNICVDKFAHLGRAIALFRGAFACWLVLIFLIGFRELT